MDDDEDPTRTAAELGMSGVRYERILRDVGQRHGISPPPGSPGRRSPRRTWYQVPFGLAALLVVLVLVSRLVEPDQPEPEYAFLNTRDRTHPVTYSSCRPLQVAVYPAGGPSDAEELVREAVALVRAASGLDIVVIGAFGGHAPNWNFEAAPITLLDPVSVSWQDGDAIERMTSDVAGLGGSPVVTSAHGTPYRVAGTIALSRDYFARKEEQGRHDLALAVVLHEFGHVLGLDHVDSSGELMYEHNIGRTSFGPGDLQGLRLLGQGPCI
jgi:hypothetical protein